MQPASAGSGSGGSGSNRQLKRWGPIVGVVVVIAVVVVVLVATHKDKKSATLTPATSTVPATTPVTTPVTTPTSGSGSQPPTTAGTSTPPPPAFKYPLSFSQAKAQGIEKQINWGPRCDTSTGRLAVPDYFAPECYAPFSGDNGGATSPGVTGDTINIVYYEGQEADPIIAYITDAIKVKDTNAQQFATMKELIRYYTTYYETYGRKVNLITFEGTGNAADEVAARADAARIAEEDHPFVVFGGPALTSAFADELATRKIMCISCTPGQPQKFYTDHDPYVWDLDASALQKQAHVVEFVKKQLAGKNATHGGDAVKNKPRKFGLLYIQSSSASKDLADKFSADMAAAGAPFDQVIAYQLDPGTIQQTAVQVITKMKAAGVTTIVFSGDPVAPRDFTKEATAQEYFPEWIIAASTLVDVTAFARTYDQQQWSHAFGVTSLAARVDASKIGAYAIYKWFTGVEPPAPDTIGVFQPAPALFFNIVQQIGPDLTPENFKAAIFAAASTRPGISAPTLSYGNKGLWPDPDYQGVDDATEIWWDPTATGIDEIRRQGTGMYEYVDGGARYEPGQWPTTDKAFDPNGAVAFYTTPPPGEDPPQYPSPA